MFKLSVIVVLVWVVAGLGLASIKILGQQLADGERAAADQVHDQQLVDFDEWNARTAGGTK